VQPDPESRVQDWGFTDIETGAKGAKDGNFIIKFIGKLL